MQTGVRAQAQSSSSISNKMCIAMKALCKHCWVQYVKWKPLIWYASSVHWVHSDTVACYKADPVRYTLSESGLCWADLQRDSMGWVKDEHSCLNVSAFFGGGTVASSLARQQQSDGKLEEVRSKLHLLGCCLLHLTATEKFSMRRCSSTEAAQGEIPWFFFSSTTLGS